MMPAGSCPMTSRASDEIQRLSRSVSIFHHEHVSYISAQVRGHLRLPAVGKHHNQHRPHRSLHGAAPLKPLPEPADLDQYCVRKQARIGGLINEYHLVA